MPAAASPLLPRPAFRATLRVAAHRAARRGPRSRPAGRSRRPHGARPVPVPAMVARLDRARLRRRSRPGCPPGPARRARRRRPGQGACPSLPRRSHRDRAARPGSGPRDHPPPLAPELGAFSCHAHGQPGPFPGAARLADRHQRPSMGQPRGRDQEVGAGHHLCRHLVADASWLANMHRLEPARRGRRACHRQAIGRGCPGEDVRRTCLEVHVDRQSPGSSPSPASGVPVRMASPAAFQAVMPPAMLTASV